MLGSQASKVYTPCSPVLQANQSKDRAKLHGKSQAKVCNRQDARLQTLQTTMREFAAGQDYCQQSFFEHNETNEIVASTMTLASIWCFDQYCCRPRRQRETGRMAGDSMNAISSAQAMRECALTLVSMLPIP